jgi:hypothetical protein
MSEGNYLVNAVFSTATCNAHFMLVGLLQCTGDEQPPDRQ